MPFVELMYSVVTTKLEVYLTQLITRVVSEEKHF